MFHPNSAVITSSSLSGVSCKYSGFIYQLETILANKYWIVPIRDFHFVLLIHAFLFIRIPALFRSKFLLCSKLITLHSLNAMRLLRSIHQIQQYSNRMFIHELTQLSNTGLVNTQSVCWHFRWYQQISFGVHTHFKCFGIIRVWKRFAWLGGRNHCAENSYRSSNSSSWGANPCSQMNTFFSIWIPSN